LHSRSYVPGVQTTRYARICGTPDDASRVAEHRYIEFVDSKSKQKVIIGDVAGRLKPFGKFREIDPNRSGPADLHGVASA
jgi:hypothetical protein